MRGIDDSLLPNVRPEKYEFMIHSEISAILTCARQGRPTKGMTIYVTGMPCLRCLQYIHQAGIKKVIYGNHTSHIRITSYNVCYTKLLRGNLVGRYVFLYV